MLENIIPKEYRFEILLFFILVLNNPLLYLVTCQIRIHFRETGGQFCSVDVSSQIGVDVLKHFFDLFLVFDRHNLVNKEAMERQRPPLARGVENLQVFDDFLSYF